MCHIGERENVQNFDWETLQKQLGEKSEKLMVDQDGPHVATTWCILQFQTDQMATGYRG
jgi:hypothetical protein